MVDTPSNLIKKNQICLIDMYKEDLASNKPTMVYMASDPKKPNHIY